MTQGSRPAHPYPAPEKWLWPAIHFLVLMFGVWLVSPFIVITPSDYLAKNTFGLRLALGLLIFIIYVGKWTFDVLAPQGLAGKVSRIRLAALILFIFIVVSFMIFVVAQAAALYLKEGIQQDAANSTEIQTSSAAPAPLGNRLPQPFFIKNQSVP